MGSGGCHYHKKIKSSKACFQCDSFLRNENGEFLWLSAWRLYKHSFIVICIIWLPFFLNSSSSCHSAERLMWMYWRLSIDLMEQWVVWHVCVDTDREKLRVSGKPRFYSSNLSYLSASFTYLFMANAGLQAVALSAVEPVYDITLFSFVNYKLTSAGGLIDFCLSGPPAAPLLWCDSTRNTELVFWLICSVNLGPLAGRLQRTAGPNDSNRTFSLWSFLFLLHCRWKEERVVVKERWERKATVRKVGEKGAWSWSL